MTDTAAIEDDLRLVEEATEHFLDQLARLDDASIRNPSRLPGWTRGHVVAHIARNADGIARLARSARSGVEEPMYGDGHPRGADIEAGAPRPLADQEADVRDSARRLDAAFASLSGDAWSARVRTGTKEVIADFLPWVRTRELWLHAIDLEAGASYRDLPPAVAARLLAELVHDLSGRPRMPALVLDTGGRPQIEVRGAGTPTRVSGSPAALACWLSGRPGPLTAAELPPLPAWL